MFPEMAEAPLRSHVTSGSGLRRPLPSGVNLWTLSGPVWRRSRTCDSRVRGSVLYPSELATRGATGFEPVRSVERRNLRSPRSCRHPFVRSHSRNAETPSHGEGSAPLARRRQHDVGCWSVDVSLLSPCSPRVPPATRPRHDVPLRAEPVPKSRTNKKAFRALARKAFRNRSLTALRARTLPGPQLRHGRSGKTRATASAVLWTRGLLSASRSFRFSRAVSSRSPVCKSRRLYARDSRCQWNFSDWVLTPPSSRLAVK